MSTCTFEGCQSIGTIPQRDRAANIWACLCENHDAQLNRAISSGNAMKILGTWVKAQGGAKAASARIG